ncbi:MAG: DUF433 domain-containing protein [Dehalococcoidia bacterium]
MSMPSELRVDELRAEVEKMRRVPGIVFADGAFGRVPRIAGTGIEVFEVVRRYHAMDRSWERLTASLHWLSSDQLRAALAYYDAYSEEVDARLAMEEAASERLGEPRAS